MVEKVPAFRSNSGKLFLSEEAAVRSEAIERLCEIIPEFALIRPRIESNLDAISQATASLVSFKAKNHPEPAPENHPAEPTVRCRYAHPPGSRCPACSHVPSNVTVIPAPEARARGGVVSLAHQGD